MKDTVRIECPECGKDIELEMDDIEVKALLSCPHCEAELEIVNDEPVEVRSLEDDEPEYDREIEEDYFDFPYEGDE
jgi:lysine biosynthesis protein LysW